MHVQAGFDKLAMSDSRGPSAAVSAGLLVRQAAGGDLDAFEELIHRLQRRVYGFAYQHLRDSEEAHDLAQEIFVKLYRNLARYDPARPFEPWFWKLAANTTINYRRKRVPIPAEPSTESADPNSTTQTHDPALVEALSQLDPAYRLPILLHYYADLSLEQVSQSLNLSIPAIKSRLHRARAQLRNSLAELEESENLR
ncbi:MAG: RNA polymerase sigma factor [Chloroflexi bacterium]|nr:MAG: RNA polymerase sigma factor [Chloroflexota bacterium]TME51015.1 MAG: RNA polymerase sigma factor [Chloroflexota bacterium]